MYRINGGNKLSFLLRAQKNIFTTADLAVLWGIENDNTLWTTVKRYVALGKLYKLRKGLYAKRPVSELSKYEIGCALMGSNSYISLESVLAQSGVIMQVISQVTLVGAKSAKVEIEGTTYVCKKAKEDVLFNRLGVNEYQGYSVATPERAVADIQFWKPKYYLDNPAGFNLQKVEEIKREVNY
ncbi:MAG: hypothetical protein ACD_22C00009G0009 [uncultured bacterium]|uniref:AbiEi antitoxin C-terminal domain-containing protein n=1 Tax=candidate division WWE3 bacterium RBG_16_37_10 TaxID=1802610 RepID=A0A1F4V4M0_UNCKA|nr:MAG: hypothetical protein ACD_22C00009G0009 [uncultured bacterium]OGC51493.1 MAG: hypothetical protein A2W32_02530 [candidate division WWE3 bacterium RBG_16_37_10]